MKHCNGGLVIFLPVSWLAARRPRRHPPLPKTVRRQADRAMRASGPTPVLTSDTAVLRTARQHEARS